MLTTRTLFSCLSSSSVTRRICFLLLFLLSAAVTAPASSQYAAAGAGSVSARPVVLLKNNGNALPIAGQPDIALLQFGKGDLSTLQDHLGNHFLSLDRYVFGEAYSAENIELIKLIGFYDQLLVAVFPGGEKEAAEINKLLRKRKGTLILFEGSTDDDKLHTSIDLAESVVYSGGTDEASQTKLASLIAGERPFADKLPKPVAGFRTCEGLTSHKTRLGYASPEEVGMDSGTLEKIDAIATEGLKAGAYPGCQVYVAKEGYIIYEKAFGYKDARKAEPNDLNTLYDLASVTKAAATDPLVMMAVTQGLLSPNDRVGKYLAYLRGSNKENIPLRNFLFHAAGMPAVIQFYKEILIDPSSYDDPLIRRGRTKDHPIQIAARDFARDDWHFRKRYVRSDSTALFPIRMAAGLYLSPKVRPLMRKEIREAPLRRGYRYSDIDFLILQDVLEEVYGHGLDTLFHQGFAEPLGLRRLLYRPYLRYPAGEIAEDTRDRFLRKQTLRGDVDDEAAAMLGGVSGNAGLFGNAHDLGVLVQVFANNGIYGGMRFISEEVVRSFTTARHDVSPYAMGFDRHRGHGRAGNTADEAPLSTYGHTGFTGTCFWVDPANDLVYIFLSNRVAPVRWNNKLSQMDIRTRIQSVLYESLDRYNNRTK